MNIWRCNLILSVSAHDYTCRALAKAIINPLHGGGVEVRKSNTDGTEQLKGGVSVMANSL